MTTGINEITTKIQAQFPEVVISQNSVYCRSTDRRGGSVDALDLTRTVRDWAREQFPGRTVHGKRPVAARDNGGWFKCWNGTVKILLTKDEKSAQAMGPHAFRALA